MDQIYTADQHAIAPGDVSINALKVVRRLTNAGFHGYVVGGGVRDLLLGAHPKDFDVATDARPEEVRDLFRNSRAVGRRFRIVHVRFGREIVEVATFRAHHDADSHGEHHAESGRILDDNVFGTLDEDAERRDFTVNALYYQPEEDVVYDRVGGMEDLRNRTLRLIGEPEKRYREDPVRMLRAVRFAAKLGFEIDEESARPIYKLAFLLRDIAPARLFDEVLKLFLHGDGERTFELLLKYRLLERLFPRAAAALDEEHAVPLIRAALRSTDRRVRSDQPVTAAFILAAFLWPPLQADAKQLQAQGMSPLQAIHEAARDLIDGQLGYTSIPRRISAPMKEIWDLQLRLARRTGRRTGALLTHKRFRAAYDFLLLREESGEELDGLGEWWTRFQEAEKGERDELLKAFAPPKRKRRRTRKRADPGS